MKSYRLILCLAAIIRVGVVQAFMTTTYDTNTRLLQRRANIQSQLAHIVQPLFLHVDNLHPHRDSVLRLEDPIPNVDHDVLDKNKMLHKLTNHVAPIVLATYLIGHYLSRYHTTLVEGGVNGDADPQIGGVFLIGAGLLMMKSVIDNSYLSPV